VIVLRRVLTVVAVMAVVLLPAAAPAQAHPVQSGLDPTNWRSIVTSVPAAVTFTLGDAAQRATVTRRGAHEVIVLGYNAEPFLRLTMSGTSRNLRSSTTWTVLGPRHSAPGNVDDHARPTWRRVSATASWTWHDLRTHWAGYALPPPVEREPNRPQFVQSWVIPVIVDGQPSVIGGRLDWVPASTSPPVATLTVLALVAAVCTGIGRRWRWSTATAATLLTALDVAHCVGMAAGRTGAIWTRMHALPGGPIVTGLLWIALAAAVTALLRRRHLTLALYGLAMLSAVIFLADAIPSLPLLWRSQAITVYAIPTARWIVAALTGTSAGLLAACILLIRRLDRHPPPPTRLTAALS